MAPIRWPRPVLTSSTPECDADVPLARMLRLKKSRPTLLAPSISRASIAVGISSRPHPQRGRDLQHRPRRARIVFSGLWCGLGALQGRQEHQRSLGSADQETRLLEFDDGHKAALAQGQALAQPQPLLSPLAYSPDFPPPTTDGPPEIGRRESWPFASRSGNLLLALLRRSHANSVSRTASRLPTTSNSLHPISVPLTRKGTSRVSRQFVGTTEPTFN